MIMQGEPEYLTGKLGNLQSGQAIKLTSMQTCTRLCIMHPGLAENMHNFF